MIHTKEPIGKFSERYGLDFTIPEYVCIINSESGVEQWHDGEWRPELGFVTSVGFMQGNRIDVFTRTAVLDPEFENEVKFKLDFLLASKHEFWAFNSRTEIGNLFALFGQHYEIRNLQPIEFTYRRETLFLKMVEKVIIPYPKEQFPQLAGKELIELWERFIADPKISLKPLINHNISSLLKEALLFTHKDALVRTLGGKL
jgi:hypothetical protein